MKIDKNIPLPRYHSKARQEEKDVFKKLRPGDSVSFPLHSQAYAFKARLYAYFSLNGIEWWSTVRKMPDDTYRLFVIDNRNQS